MRRHTISLIRHVLKIFVNLYGRIYRKYEGDKTEEQFEFRNVLGTRDPLFFKQILFERCCDVNEDANLLFIDYKKAFNKVKHEKLFDILKQHQADAADLRIIQNLFQKQNLGKVQKGKVWE